MTFFCRRRCRRHLRLTLLAEICFRQYCLFPIPFLFNKHTIVVYLPDLGMALPLFIVYAAIWENGKTFPHAFKMMRKQQSLEQTVGFCVVVSAFAALYTFP
jgi:hypothetical protein